MTPKLTLYRADKACSLAAHILLLELGIPFTPVLMAFGPEGVESADGSLSHKDYLKINPAGYVPALRIDDDTITELPAILTYVAGLAPERQLFGKSNLDRAKVYRWLCWLSGTLHGAGYGAILRPGRFTSDEAFHGSIVQKGMRTITECYERIERSLEGEHVVGDGFTVADIHLYIFWGWGYRNNFEMAKQYPKYGTLVKAVEQMDSVRAALHAEGMALQFP